MRATILLAVLGTFVSSEVIQMDIRSTGSLRTRLLNKRGLEDLTPRNNLRNAKQRALRPQPIFDYYDNYFLGSIALGTPPQMFNNMLLDTGSSNLWVIDAMCNMSACQGSPASGYNKTLFDTSMSSTYQAQSTLFNINYGSASVQGHLAMDMFALRNLTYATQQFGVVTSLDMMFGEEPIDGIFGLAWPSLAANSVVPPLQNLLPQLDAPLFTVWLDRAYGPMTAGEINGVITYGAIDPNHCDPSDVQYTPLTAETYWQFNLNGFSVGSYSNPSRQTAVSDTGTPRLGAPSADVNGLMTAINATYVAMYDHYEIDCNAMAPDLVFTIGGRQYNIPFSVYTLDLGMGPSSCVVTVYPVNGGGFGPSWILGDTFIRTYCNVYDIGNQQIGFGRAFHSDIATTTPSM